MLKKILCVIGAAAPLIVHANGYNSCPSGKYSAFLAYTSTPYNASLTPAELDTQASTSCKVSKSDEGVVFYIWNNTNNQGQTGQALDADSFLATDGYEGSAYSDNCNYAVGDLGPLMGLISPGNALTLQQCYEVNQAMGALSVGPYTFVLQHGSRGGTQMMIPALSNYQLGLVQLTAPNGKNNYSTPTFNWGVYNPIGNANNTFSSVSSPSALATCTSDVCGYFSYQNCRSDFDAHGNYQYTCDAVAMIVINAIPPLPPYNAQGVGN